MTERPATHHGDLKRFVEAIAARFFYGDGVAASPRTPPSAMLVAPDQPVAPGLEESSITDDRSMRFLRSEHRALIDGSICKLLDGPFSEPAARMQHRSALLLRVTARAA